VRGAVSKRAVKHGMADIDRVRVALDGAFQANAKRLSAYSPRVVWNGARAATVSLTVMTKTIIANFTITDDEVLVEGKIPFLFSHLDGKIMSVLSEQVETCLAKARAEQA
jgi:hypothetical protein